MQFTTTLFATLAAFATLAMAVPQGFGGDFGIPNFNENEDDNQNNNINQNDNQNDNIQDNFQESDSFRSIDNIMDSFCNTDEAGALRYLGKRGDVLSRLAKRQFNFPGFENLDFNNNQNANVNQNANQLGNFLQNFDEQRESGGDFVSSLGGGGFSSLIDCFFNDEGALVAGRR